MKEIYTGRLKKSDEFLFPLGDPKQNSEKQNAREENGNFMEIDTKSNFLSCYHEALV